jgi:hypothetical protein
LKLNARISIVFTSRDSAFLKYGETNASYRKLLRRKPLVKKEN